MSDGKWIYDIFPERCISEISGEYIIYGIKVLEVSPLESTLISEAHFITKDYKKIQALTKQFNDRQLAPCHLDDVLRDFDLYHARF